MRSVLGALNRKVKLAACLVAGTLLGGTSTQAADGTWNVDAASNWGVEDSWLEGIIADGVGVTANFTFDITVNRTVTIESGVSRTVGVLNFGDPNGSNGRHLEALGPGIISSGTNDGGTELCNWLNPDHRLEES